MQDQEIMTDLLLTEKKMSTNYSLHASECVNTQLRDNYPDLDEFCAAQDVNREELEVLLASVGFTYDPFGNRFA